MERRHGITVRHPRFVSIPRIGMALQPASVASASMRATRDLQKQGWSCDVIDAHYLYPDGVAAAVLAERLQRPFVVTARGSDVNLIAQMPGPRRRILAASARAGRVITVSQALKRALMDIGVPESAIEVLGNGVDTDLFRPVARDSTRKRLGVDQVPLIVSVGNLVPEKGHDLVLRAAHRLQDACVAVVGRGSEEGRLHALVGALGMQRRVRFIDNLPQAELASIYSAADVLALGSVREGWPNVLLEAMACGTPVVAAAVGGVPEIVADAVAGEVVAERNEADFAAALQRLLMRRIERSAVRARAAQFSWAPIARRYYEILSTVGHSSAVAGATARQPIGATP
jgi:glycosyltransferase involved in cell wall biosynthesis